MFGFGQTSISAKLYGHLAIDGARGVPVIDQSSSDLIKFRWVTPAIQICLANGKYHEFEFTNLLLQTAQDEVADTRLSFGVKYERGKNFTKNPESTFRFLVGVSARGYFGYEQLNALNPNGWPTENRVLGLALAINPHLEYHLFRNFYFDFSPYCEVLNFAGRDEYVYNEFIPEELRGAQDFYLLRFQLFLRFGLAWRF
jgi:hypothetical protein